MTKASRIHLAPSYGGHSITIDVYTEDGRRYRFETSEATEFLLTQLNKVGFTLDLKPRQQMYRIKPKTVCQQ